MIIGWLVDGQLVVSGWSADGQLCVRALMWLYSHYGRTDECTTYDECTTSSWDVRTWRTCELHHWPVASSVNTACNSTNNKCIRDDTKSPHLLKPKLH